MRHSMWDDYWPGQVTCPWWTSFCDKKATAVATMHSGGWLSSLVSAVGWKAGDPLLKMYGEESMQGNRQTLHDCLLSLRDHGPWLDLPDLCTGEVPVSLWLDELKKALRDADAVLEEWRCQVLGQMEEIGGQSATKVRSFFGVRDPVTPPLPFTMDLKVELKDVVHRIWKAVVVMVDLFPEFHFHTSMADSSVPVRGRCHPRLDFADETRAIGREKDAEEVIKLLIDKNLRVISIVGMGGIGKTTLARMVFDNGRVQQHFPVRLWVTVSDDLNITRVLQGIIGLAIQEHSLVHRHVQEILRAKRFLLVLDDVRSANPNNWDKLMLYLKYGGMGSTILMTTRSEYMYSSHAYYLGKLADDHVWSIVNHIASDAGQEEGLDLVKIREVTVTMCEGIPLSAAILGGLLGSRLSGDLDDWLVSWADICDTRHFCKTVICNEGNFSDTYQEDTVFLAIELSYKHLPSYVKGCFAFCSVFPRNHEIDKDMLIQLWMANDLIPSDDVMDLEVKGSWIFDELVSRCFFQDVKHVLLSQSIRTKCRMHDLVYDAAVFVANIEFTTILSSAIFGILGNDQIRGVHHMSIVSCYKQAPDMPLRCASNLHNLRTLLSLEEQYPLDEWHVDFSSCNSLRVLDLHGFHSTTVSIPSIFLKHLRYLDLSKSWIMSIPDDVVHLYNLQTLRLSECCYLSQLPKELWKRKSLRQLYLDGCFRLENVPPHLGQLRDLRTLTTFIVGSDSGCGIEQLKDLKLEGQLELYNLKNVKMPEDAEGMNLHSKENLRHLSLCWGKFRDGKIMAENAEEVLEALQPPKGLQLLKIWRYAGLAFPRWIANNSSLNNLIKLFLMNCDQCHKLPPIWHLKTLELLCLDQMNSLEYICSNDTVDANECHDIPQAFPKLKEMTLLNMQSLKGWQEAEKSEIITLPQLEEMSVINCPMLKMMPVTPLLKHLTVGANEQQLCSLAPSAVRTKTSWFRL